MKEIVSFDMLSIILGIFAIVFTVMAIKNKDKAIFKYKKNTLLGWLFCNGAIIVQFFEMKKLLIIGDISAIEDTIKGRYIASIILLVLLLILHLVGLIQNKKYKENSNN